MLSHCDCCGLMVNARTEEDCPRCHYPINQAREERFLDSAISDLQRVAAYGGANLRVLDLISRYQRRLNALRQESVMTRPVASSILPTSVSLALPPAPAPLLPPVGKPTRQQPSLPLPGEPDPLTRTEERSPTQPLHLSPQKLASAPSAPTAQAVSQRVFSLRSFFADQAINIVASLGAFLILAGALSFIATTPNLLLSFLIVFFVHALFGTSGFIAARIPTLRVVATIYTIIFAFLIPLVGFSAYRLVVGNALALSPEVLIAIAAVYAAVVYIVLALFQRFVSFAYLAMLALLIADLAVARAFGLDYQWWPEMAMILALAALILLPRSPSSVNTWPFGGAGTLLRQPVRLLTYGIPLATAIGALLISFYSFSLESISRSSLSIRASIFAALALLLLWGSLFLLKRKQSRGTRELAYLLLLSVLALCYWLDLPAIDYALALTGVALLYHVLSRYAGRFCAPLSELSPDLDHLALVLIALVPFMSSPLLPVQLFASVSTPLAGLVSPFEANGQAVFELLLVGIGLALSISITLRHTGLQRVPSQQAWCWLLLLSGFLLIWGYSLGLLIWHGTPTWAFLGLSLALVMGTVFARQRLASAWANPLDLLAVSAMLLTLLSGQTSATLCTLLLFFAALTYGALVFQQRQTWLFLPLLFTWAAQPLLLQYPVALFLLSLALPLVAAAMSRLSRQRFNESARQQQSSSWARPPLATGLLYGTVFVFYEALGPKSTVEHWLHLTFPVTLELALLSLAWYAAAALARTKWWMVPAVVFALAALLLPGNAFRVLATLTFLLAIMGAVVNRFAGRDWALPLNLIALCSAVLTTYIGLTQDHWAATTWILLGFAILAYLIGVANRLLLALEIAPCFAIASAIISSILLGDPYRPPLLALICAILGSSPRLPALLPSPISNLWQRLRASSPKAPSHLLYALPFYITSLGCALLMGISGTLLDINYPFYSAIPDALLLFALIAFGVLLLEQRPGWLWLVAGLAVWGIVLAVQLQAYYMVGVAVSLGIGGLLVGRFFKPKLDGPASLRARASFTWSWPWYIAALVAACLAGLWPLLPESQPPLTFIVYSLSGFAFLAYVIGSLERTPTLLWFGPAFTLGSLLYSRGDVYLLIAVALLGGAAGLTIHQFDRFALRFQLNAQGRSMLQQYVAPCYTTALAAALLVGIHGSVFSINDPFYSAIPDALLLFALAAFGIMLLEQRPGWLWLVAGLSIWSINLATQLAALYVAMVGVGIGILGVVAARLSSHPSITIGKPSSPRRLFKLTWSWPWYLSALVAAVSIGTWPPYSQLYPGPTFLGYGLLAFTALAFLVMLVERRPALFVFPAGLAAWAIWQWQFSVPLAWLMIVYSGLCVLIFAAQFTWRLLPPATNWISETLLHTLLGLGGQGLIVLTIVMHNGLSAASGNLAPVGVGALLELAALVFASGYLKLHNALRLNATEDNEILRETRLRTARTVRTWCNYSAGLLLSLAISWAFSSLHLTRFDLLTLAPATYLSVIAPFLMRDETVPRHHTVGQILTIGGGTLLLLPTLWLSFSDTNLLPTLLLLGEALGLLLLGITTRIRIFVLSSASLIIVGGLHMLFLPALGIPPSLALTLLGILLLALATGFALARHQLQSAWTSWE